MSEFLRISLDIIRDDRLFDTFERWRESSTSIEFRDDIVMTIIEFLISRDDGTTSIRLIVCSGNIDEGIDSLKFPVTVFIDGELETSIIRIDEAEIFRSHREEEFLESICEIVTRVTIDGRGIEIDEEVFDSHSLHVLDRLFR